jgi:hypothetical protein
MKAAFPTLAACILLLCACASPRRPQAAPGAQALGVPSHTVDTTVETATTEENRDSASVHLPDRIVIPAAYRLLLLDGRLTLVRDTDPQIIDPGPSSLRVVTGESSGGDLSYQPALLPQELAAEVASNRESSARMDNALDSVMQRSRELSEQATELEAQAKRLGDLLAAAQAKPQKPKATIESPTASIPPNAPEN